VSGVSAFISAIAVIIAVSALKEQAAATKFVIFESCFNRILDLEKELYSEYADKREDEKKRWDSLFFNSIEELSFLSNEGYLDDPKMINFFSPAIITWYEQIFKEHYPEEVIKNPDVFPEMKKLYKKIKKN